MDRECKFGILHPEGRRFEPSSSCHVVTLGKASRLYNVMNVAPCVAALWLNSMPAIIRSYFTCKHYVVCRIVY